MGAKRKERADQRRREEARQVRQWSVEAFHDRMAEAGVTRAYVASENGEFLLSHPGLLGPIQSFFELSQDFARHEGVFIGREDGFRTLFFAFVHDTRRGLSQGGLRFRRYGNLAEVLVDGLRLAQGMTRKNALAGLWWGGGKGILPVTLDLDGPAYLDRASPRRAELFRAYGRFVASLGGIYYTAEDIGTNTNDLKAVLSENRFTTCIPPGAGGSGNPSAFTAKGVFKGMQAGWAFLTGSDDLAGVRVAVQGAGHVGEPLIRELDDAGAKVWFTDVDEKRVAELVRARPGLVAVPPDRILEQDVDVVAPCAIGAVVNSETIPKLRCRLVCGAANNILKEPADAERLRARGILFVPDYVANRMGITNCADEWRGYLEEDVWVAAERVYPDTLRVLKHARNLSTTTTRAADELADSAATELHPLLGHRGRRLIDHLVRTGWGGDRPERSRGAVEPAFRPALDEPPIRNRWEREGLFQGPGPAIAAAPISTATRPNLASFLSPLLADVAARAIEWTTGVRPRRVLGSDHGGRALQLAIEESLPYERERYARPAFVEMCRDRHHRNEAAIREQLRGLGVGFDAQRWLDPMSRKGKEVVRRLYHHLLDAGRVVRETRLIHHCIRCRTALVASDVVRSSATERRSYAIRFRTATGDSIETTTFDPEFLLGAVALAVRAHGPYAGSAGLTVAHPLRGYPLPVRAVEDLGTDAAFLVPAHNLRDERLARELGIDERPVILDGQGQVVAAGFAGLDRDQVRDIVLARLGEAATLRQGEWRVERSRCRRCEALTIVCPSRELFVHLDDAVGHLANAIRAGSVVFNDRRWAERVLDHLGRLEPWCISRQQWWGHWIPDSPDEVFSSWFSMAATALDGAGWPAHPSPAPIAEVFVDPHFLLRWIVPAQLVGVLVTGRPAFRRVHVHGALDIVERSLEDRSNEPDPAVRPNDPDEERFQYRTIRRPMRRNLGNVVEPGALVLRFGADALRLGYLLSIADGFSESATASETRLREARHVLHRLVSKATGLFAMGAGGPPRLGDAWFLARWTGIAARIRSDYEERRFAAAASAFVEAVGELAQYSKVAAARRRAGEAPGATRATVARALAECGPAFSPLCPYAIETLADWSRRQTTAAESPAEAVRWLPDLVEELRRRAAEPAQIGVADRVLLERLQADRTELERLAGRTGLSPTERPTEGSPTVVGPCVIVRPGASIPME